MSRRITATLSLVFAAACAPEPQEAAAAVGSTEARTRPLVVETREGAVSVLPVAPMRVVPANTAAAEFACAVLGAARVAALPEQVDAYSYRTFQEQGFDTIPRFARYEAEALIDFGPDLVVTHVWQSADTTDVLRSHGIPILILPSAQSYDDIRRTLLDLGRIVGAEAKAREIVAGLDQRVAKLAETAPPRAALRALVYSNDGTGGWTAGVDTTADTFIRMAGLQNAALAAGIRGHVSVDFERLISVDPDILVVSRPARDDLGSATTKTLAATPALQGLKAVRNRRIAELSSALMSSDSLSLVEAAEELAAQVDRWIAAGEK